MASFENWLQGGVLQESFLKNYTKFTEKYLSLSNTLKALQAIRLAFSLKRHPLTSILEPAIRKCSLK